MKPHDIHDILEICLHIISSVCTFVCTSPKMSCACHPFIKKDDCLAEGRSTCVSYASLVTYNHLDTVPIPRTQLKKVWTKAFPQYKICKDYTVDEMMVDLFYDQRRALHEAKLTILFEKHAPNE